ncbi:hypothetical protein AAVH_09035 [Aphelenchoides avenae]|nr:hypothetical protein AAVH_09035 [Aphelenchus avenae]
MRAFKFRLHIDFSGKRIDLFTAALLRFRRRLVTTMLLFTVLATLLCSSLVDARKAPVDSPDALALCRSQPKCNNPAVQIDEGTFRPTIKASGGVSLTLAVESNQPLTLPIKAEKDQVTWEITRPDSDKCLWKIRSDDGTVKFEEWTPGKEEPELRAPCNGKVGRDVDISIRSTGTRYSVDVKGKCDFPPPSGTLSACDYAPPDSTSSPGWQIWRLSVSASPTDSTASITLKDAYVVYNAPDPTTITANASFDGNVTTIHPNSTTIPHNLNGSTTAEVGFGSTTEYALLGGCVLFFVLFVLAVIAAVILYIKLKKSHRSPTKEGPRKKDGLDDRSKPIPLDGNGIVPEIAICESKSKRMVDEKQLAAAEAQNPAPGETPTELKSQVTNNGPDGASTQPAADPTNNV